MLSVCAAALEIAAAAHAHDGPTKPAGHSTLEQTIVGGNPSEDFSFLQLDGRGEPYFVREDLASGKAGREDRRRSIVYLAQLTDLQIEAVLGGAIPSLGGRRQPPGLTSSPRLNPLRPPAL